MRGGSGGAAGAASRPPGHAGGLSLRDTRHIGTRSIALAIALDKVIAIVREIIWAAASPPASPDLKQQVQLARARCKSLVCQEILERAKGFEPSTPTLARSCSCFNALPHVIGAVYKKRAGYSADITMTQ